MNLNPAPNPSVFPVRSQVTAALQRAAELARVVAEQTGTKLIVVEPVAKSTPQDAAPPPSRHEAA